MLRQYRDFARAYVDDIVVFSNTLEEHLQHLDKIFALFDEYNLAIKPTKTYLGFPSVALLGQKVDSLGLSTTEEKLAAINQLIFPQSLKDLKTYLGMTGWLRNYIAYYAQIVELLQARKTLMLRGAPNKGKARKAFSRATQINTPTESELQAFQRLQEVFREPIFLVHHDLKRQLYADVDALKRGFGAVVYYVKGDKIVFGKEDVEPIMFLSKMLTPAESRYWPTELETAGLVWLVKRIKHLIVAQKSNSPGNPRVTVYTDHSATTSIVKQTKLTTSSTDKLNLRLVRALMYLSQFNLDV